MNAADPAARPAPAPVASPPAWEVPAAAAAAAWDAPPPAPAMSNKEQSAFAGAQAYTPPAYTPPPAALGGVGAAGAAAAPGGHRFVAMRTIAGLCNILAWVSVGLTVLGALGSLVVGGFDFLTLLVALVGGTVSAVLGWIFWRLLGEGIWLALDIESNTRRMANALEKERHS